MRDLGRHSATDQTACTRFHWLDSSLLLNVLPRLGFAPPTIVRGPDNGLDIARLYVAAEFVDPVASGLAATRLAPVGGDATNRKGSLA